MTAAILIGHTAGVKQFRKHSSFGLQTGTAPIPCSSGQRTQHRLNRGGDRQLNHALHIIAITRAQRDPATKEYLARKEAEGKTTKGALRSLKRHLARRFYHLLAEPPADQPQAANGKPTARARAAGDPRTPPPRARSPADQHSAQPDGLHQLDRPRPRPPGPFSGPLPAAVTAHPRPRSPQIGAILADTGPTNVDQRILSPSAALDQRPATVSTPDPNPSQTIRPLPSKPIRNTQIATHH